MSVETPTNFSTLKNFKQYDVLATPDFGGRFQPNDDWVNSQVQAQVFDRNLHSQEPQEPQKTFVESSPNLRFRNIPKWDMRAEMDRFFNDINYAQERGLSREEAVAQSAKIFEFHVRGYHSEITKTNPVLLHLNKFQEIRGQERIVGSNGRPIVESISPKERNGAVLKASKKIETDLTSDQTPNNTFDVLMSTDGWHGFTDQAGNELSPHKNAQVLVFWKDGQGKLKGLTFHADLNLSQSEQLMCGLGVDLGLTEGKTDKQRIIDVVSNPASLPVPATYDNPFDYVLDKMLSVRGNGPFRLKQDDGSVEIRDIEQIRENIKNFDQLLKGNLAEEGLITSLTKFLIENSLQVEDHKVQQQIVDLAEKTLLKLARVYLHESGKIPLARGYEPIIVSHGNYGVENRSEEDDFARELAFLKTRAGCPPGMLSNGSALAGYGIGGAVAVGGMIFGGDLERDRYESLYFVCPNGCGKLNKRPKGKLINTCGEGQTGGCGKSVKC